MIIIFRVLDEHILDSNGHLKVMINDPLSLQFFRVIFLLVPWSLHFRMLF